MSKKCQHCGRISTDPTAIICPDCKTILPRDVVADEKPLTHEQEVKIAEMVADRLANNKKFKSQIVKSFVGWVLAVLGVIGVIYSFSLYDSLESLKRATTQRLTTVDLQMSNQIAATEGRIEVTISNQFADPRIKDLMDSVAATQASNLLVQQISPQIQKFDVSTSDTLEKFDNQLSEFETLSSNAIANVKAVSDFGILVTRANSDDYGAFVKLKAIGEDLGSPYQQIAVITINSILSKNLSLITPNPLFHIFWKVFNVEDPDKTSFEQFKNVFNSEIGDSISQSLILEYIFNDNKLGKRDRMEFAMDLLQNSMFTLVRSKAFLLISQESKNSHNVLYLQEQIDWWNAHKADYSNSVPTITH